MLPWGSYDDVESSLNWVGSNTQGQRDVLTDVEGEGRRAPG